MGKCEHNDCGWCYYNSELPDGKCVGSNNVQCPKYDINYHLGKIINPLIQQEIDLEMVGKLAGQFYLENRQLIECIVFLVDPTNEKLKLTANKGQRLRDEIQEIIKKYNDA